MAQMIIDVKGKSTTPVLEWVDCELSDSYYLSFTRTQNTDVLLELRALITGKMSLGQMVKRFYGILPRLERSYYLLGYRIRQWISLNYLVRVSDPMGGVEAKIYTICQTDYQIDSLRKCYFEECNYAINFFDIRLEVIER